MSFSPGGAAGGPLLAFGRRLQASGRKSSMNRRFLMLVAALVGLLVVAACGLGGKAADPVPVAAAPSASEPENIVDPVEETEDPTPEPTTPSPTKKAKPKPTKSKKTTEPIWDEAPACATYTIAKNKQVAKTKVKAALKTAAARQYWRTEAPKLRVNYSLVRAVAWHESGWQSHIRNCDGGFGVMQVMPDTVAQMNQRFGLSYDPEKYQENALVGSNYLAWLTKYFGDKYFKKSYNLSAGKCPSHTSTKCLLNLVIAGYNAGSGAVDDAHAGKALPNPQYVDTVRSLMAKCPCDRI
jgi:soluble lytic murein transglycosylase-like protein